MTARRKALLVAAILVLGAPLTLVGVAVFNWLTEPDPQAIFRDAVQKLKSPLLNAQGDYWVGDVAELYRLGRVSRRVAEADTAPIKPLVERPRPLHGYFVRAMESGPDPNSATGGDTVPLKGKTQYRGTSAFCIYPASAGKDLSVWIVCPTGIFRKPAEGNAPVLEWPKDPKDVYTWVRLD